MGHYLRCRGNGWGQVLVCRNAVTNKVRAAAHNVSQVSIFDRDRALGQPVEHGGGGRLQRPQGREGVIRIR